MKKFIVIMSLLALPMFLFSQSVEGTWKTFDEKTGKEKSIVKVYKNNGKLYGKVVKVLSKQKGTIPKCVECKGKLKNANIEGMMIIYDLELKKGKWQAKNGILDPENGKFYKCKLWLESKNKLSVRGQIGPIGRTQVWQRVK